MKTGIGISILAAILLCCICLPVRADLITIGFTGKINHSIVDPLNVFGGQIHLNDTVTGTYTYDISTPDSDPEGYSGAYWHYSAPCGVSVNINNFIFQTDPNNVLFKVGIGNNRFPSGEDSFSFISYNNSSLPSGALVENIGWQLEDSTGTAFSSDALPTTAPNLADWDFDYGLTITGPRGWDYALTADITSVMLIPEPATLLLLAFGVAICKYR